MSTTDSNPERVRELRGDALDRLRSYGPLLAHLERVESIDDGTNAIVPDPMLRADYRKDDRDPPDAAVAVMADAGSSTRENRQERANFIVQSRLVVREATMDRNGLPWFDDIGGFVADVLTDHSDPWVARGADGGSSGSPWNDSTNRYESVQRFSVQSWG